MGSKTKKVEAIRARKHKKSGSARKAAAEKNGTTLPAAELFKVQDA